MNKIENIQIDLTKTSKKCEDFFEKLVLAALKEIEAFVSHKSPPKGYPSDKGHYADPKNYKYPINSKSRVLAAWRYINQPKNQKGYTPEEVASIKGRIKGAAKKYGLDLKEGK